MIIIKKIGVQKEVLEALPRNNAKIIKYIKKKSYRT